MQREIDAVAVICGGNSDSGGRNWVFGFDFGGRKGWVLSLGEGDFSVTNEREIFFFLKKYLMYLMGEERYLNNAE